MPYFVAFLFSLFVLAATPSFAQDKEECVPAINVLQSIDKVKPVLDGKIITKQDEVDKLAELEGVKDTGYNVAVALAHGNNDFTLLFGFKVEANSILCVGHTVPHQKLREFLAIVIGEQKARPVPGQGISHQYQNGWSDAALRDA